ncbi:MAG: DinB family protein [Acidobacteria bacterium]|nr:DinB family protein [Acidobacteriota bacterium]MBV9434866.1 DinB family protein [Acidobacteriota bacterium]
MTKASLVAIACFVYAASLAAQAMAQAAESSSRALDYWVSRAEKEIVPAAEAMPADNYSFTPSGSGFAGVRSFAEQVKHLSAANYQLAALILGEAPAHGERDETAPESIRSKDEIVDYLKGSFAYLHRAAAAVNEGNLLLPLAGHRTRMGIVIDAVAHSYDHYGQLVEYLRMNNIVPPASRK